MKKTQLFGLRAIRLGIATIIGATVFIPAHTLRASTYDGQSVHLDGGESVSVTCPRSEEEETPAEFNQYGNTHYYFLRCSSGDASTPSPSNASAPVVEHSNSGDTTVHMQHGHSLDIICYGGAANLETFGNTENYALNCRN
jgi:hypothetical protein